MKDIGRRTQQNLEVSEPPPPSDQFGYDQKVTTVTVRSYLPSVAALLALLWTGCHQQSANAPGTGSQFDTSPVSELNAANQGGAPDPLVRTDDQWRQLLTPEQYSITRKKGTEPPRSGKYWNSTKSGIYRCVCCGAELFSSQHKYDSGTGWPSFWKPLNPSTVGTERDDSLFWESRVEVHCRKCAAHLGHVFEDGPQPTGLRYCINSVALKLDPDLAPDP